MPFLPSFAVTSALLVSVLLTSAGGCVPRDEATRARDRSETPRSARVPVDEEAWSILYLHEQPVGWQFVRLYETEQDGKRYQAGEARSHLTVLRFGQPMSQTSTFRSEQTAEGEVVTTVETSESGAARSSTSGRRSGPELVVTSERGGNSSLSRVSLPAACGGFFAVEWSLRNQPMQPGERRELRAFAPLLNQPVTILLEARGWQERPGTAGPQRLLRVEQELRPREAPPLKSELLADETGVVWESTLRDLGQRTQRCGRSEAMAIQGLSVLDLGKANAIPIPQEIHSPETIARIRYRISVRGQDPAKLFPTTERQAVRMAGAGMIEVEVDHGEAVLEVESGSPPIAEDSTASPLVQSDASEIREMAAEATSGADSPLARAVAIEQHVFRSIHAKDYSSALASAVEVARARRGDCTEHAVLTAALCRATGIPARCIIGLVHVPAQKAFAFHMWNEAWVGSRWHPLDSTLSQGHIGAVRLVVSRNSLGSRDAFAAFAPVLSVMGKLRIEVAEIVRAAPQIPQPSRPPRDDGPSTNVSR